MPISVERRRLREARLNLKSWRRWGAYLSERQWGTVREDYSADGDAWNYLTHDEARSRAYRWGEDGLAGICDNQQKICLALALWNEADPFFKERLFGLVNSEGNHGEDVKELYYYLDALPTHAYLKYLYKYPQRAFPYRQLVEENARRNKQQPEFELLDTGAFDEGRYFDVFVEYAKADPGDILMLVTAHNRGPEAAPLHVIPQIWFRNTWSWNGDTRRPRLAALSNDTVKLEHHALGTYWLYAEQRPELWFCDNETNVRRLFGTEAEAGASPYGKDAFHDYLIGGDRYAINPRRTGTKAGLHHATELAAGGSYSVALRLVDEELSRPFADFDEIMERRRREADEFYDELECDLCTDGDLRQIHRQALAGMVWGQQFYRYDVAKWLAGDPAQPAPPPERRHGRNSEWEHVNHRDVISMPDKWEYPWFAAWDLAFHCLPLALIDADFAKQQLVLLTREWYMHPNGQLPAYEWNFSDVNPPVHAWATWRVFQIDRRLRGDEGDLPFLERVFHKLLLNFTWWVNRKDVDGHNIFQGGFLGLDNIGVFDRSKPLPTGGHINQADGTSWMGMFCLNMMRIALELAQHNPVYQDIATKFFEHFLYIARAITDIAGQGIGLWDPEDEFYYDVLKLSDGQTLPLKVRSMVGLIPMFAVETLEPELLKRTPEFTARMQWFLEHRPDLAGLVARWETPGRGSRKLLSLLRGHRMKALLRRMLDPQEFLSDYGVRSLSRAHREEPYVFACERAPVSVSYQPAESDSYLFGGNSNWRGPIWFPVNYLIIESLQRFHHYYGDDFQIECPTGSGRYGTILEASEELTRRLSRLFQRDAQGRRPVFGDCRQLNDDPHFRDYLLFYEYFDGDTGRGLGASHQTGWTGLIAKLLQPRRPLH